MAVSFSAEYLFRGAAALSRTQPEYNPALTRNLGDQVDVHEYPEPLLAAARAAYALGILLIAPCGILYHASAAGASKLRTLNVQALAHLDALKADAIALLVTAGSMFQVAILITLLVAPKFLLSLPMIFITVPSLALTAFIAFAAAKSLLPSDFWTGCFPPYGFARNPRYFNEFVWRAEERRSYNARWIYQTWVRAGVALDRPLNENEIERINEIESGVRHGNPYLLGFTRTHAALREQLRITPAWNNRSRAIIEQEQAISGAWNATVSELTPNNATLAPGALYAIRVRAAENVEARLAPIRNALPAVGAPG